MTEPKGAAPARTPSTKAVTFTALVGAACAALCVPLVQSWEGKRNVGYHDIVKVATACYGQTGAGIKVGQRYSDAQCEAMLDRALVDHAAPVLKCVPTLAGHPPQLAAAVSLAYNIGPSAFCGSTAARRFRARQWAAACDAFLSWRFASGREVAGLLNRRRAERALCMKDLPA